jgi:YidC/Oxa1 family membrane protein insertase
MEKRVLLAIVLSFMVLILWSYLFPPQRQSDQSAIKAPEPHEETTKSKEPSRQEEKTIPDTKERRISLPQKEIHIETPLYKMTLSTEGTTITQFLLKRYYKDLEKKEMVDIAKVQSEQLPHLTWVMKGLRDESVEVECSNETISLSESSKPGQLTIQYKTSLGEKVYHKFTFYPDSYKIDVETSLGSRDKTEGSISNVILNINGHQISSKSYELYSGFSAYLDKSFKHLELSNKNPSEQLKGSLKYLALETTYFVTSLILPEDFRGKVTVSQGAQKDLFAEANILDKTNEQKEVMQRYALYLGPKELEQLKKVGDHLDELVDFGWTNFIAKPLLYGMKFCNDYVRNYGISIIILTIFVKIIFWPLSNKSYKSMKEMQKIQPLLMKIREKYKDNKEQMNKELMQLYRTYKINPMSGCLPIIVQIPVFFALYKVLSASIELRHAPFMLWIKDLSAPDRLFNFSFSIPLMDPPYGIPVLTLLMGASMFIQQKMSPPPGDPTQAKVMLLLPLIFTFMFINFPSGLVLYWFVNNILSIAQQYYIQKKL